MKKQLIMLATIGVAVCCLGACKNTDDNGGESGEWAALNAMLGLNYSQIEISVSDTFDEDTSLESKYKINYSASQITVEYTVEKFVEISLDNPSSSVKTTLTGKAFINDGNISFSGDEVDITADIAELGFTFEKSYFSNIELTGNYLMADVKKPSDFVGSKLVCSDMKLKAFFLEYFYDIQINYVSEIGSAVKIYIEFVI